MKCAQHVTTHELLVLHTTLCDQNKNCPYCLARLRLLAPVNQSQTLPLEHVVSPAMPGTNVAGLARNRHPDRLVVGALRIKLTGEDMESSTVYRIVSHSACPVLLICLFHQSQRGVDRGSSFCVLTPAQLQV